MIEHLWAKTPLSKQEKKQKQGNKKKQVPKTTITRTKTRANGSNPGNTVTVIRGRGDYTYDKPGPWGETGRQVGELLGNHFGGGVGKTIGGKLGSYAHYIGRIFGSGDYAMSPGFINSNNIINPDQAPMFRDGGNTVRIAHREYLFDVLSSAVAGQFQVQNIPINPGLQTTFPWLANLTASTYQQYRINGMVFEFRSTSSELTSSVNLGYVVMATDYDSSDVPFTTKSQMENTSLAVSAKPSSNAIHAIECARGQTSVSELYIRGGPAPAGTDVRLYDHGRFSIATGGVSTSSATLGELWVSYDITLFKPILFAPGSTIQTYRMNILPTGANPLAVDTTVYLPQPRFNSFAAPVTNTPNSLIFSPQMSAGSLFVVEHIAYGASTAGCASPNITFSGGLVARGLYGNNARTAYYAPQSATGTTVITIYGFSYDGSGTVANPPTLTVGTGNYPIPSTGDILVSQINGAAFV